MSLQEYQTKRDFKKTIEPKGKQSKTGTKIIKDKKIFVIQKHHASHLHYDFRLELDGVLKSWAVPKGPSLDPHVKRLAVEVEDHPIEYASFEGKIPQGEYGAGHVIVWDKGQWVTPKNAKEQLKNGKLEFELLGEKLQGQWILLRTNLKSSGKKTNWLLIKRNDESASTSDVTKQDESVLSGVTLEYLEKDMKEVPAKKKISKTPFPKFIKPQLALLSETAPVDEDWIHEIKYDGYRTMCRKNKQKIQLLTRSGLDWSEKYSALLRECQKLPVESIVMDGEIVWIDENGRSSFQKLQNSLEAKKSEDLIYYVFDVTYLNGMAINHLPLLERKKLLYEVIKKTNTEKIIFSPYWHETGENVFKSACKNKLEGIISKKGSSAYEPGRNKTWLKTKCKNIQEFIIGGYTHQTSGMGLGSLLMGAYNSRGEFQYIGRVGTGFNNKTQNILLSKLKKLENKKSDFIVKSPKDRDIHWVKLKLVANIEFGAWTDEKILRHAAFKGLREDKDIKNIYLDENLTEVKEIEDFKLSNADKLLFPKVKITKQDLLDYYQEIQHWILPYLTAHPLSILRCPNGEGTECFFQKHITTDGAGILGEKVYSKLKNKTEEILYVDSVLGLKELVQLGTLEIHMRGCEWQNIDFPDQIIFDLDPDPGIKFKAVIEAAFALKELLERLKLKSFIKTSGGKGLHIQVPIAAIYDWDQIKNFSKTVCEQLVQENPGKFTTNILKVKRKGKIFLDYLRNGFGATAIVPYSVRAHPSAPIALPLTWDEAKKLKTADQFPLKKVLKILKTRKDPWKGYFTLHQKVKILDQFI